MKKLKRKGLAGLSDGIEKYEDSRNALKTSDFTDLRTFMSDYLNTPDKKQRRRLAEEFRKRHMELYAFMKENQQLISADTELLRMIRTAVDGETDAGDLLTGETSKLDALIRQMRDDA